MDVSPDARVAVVTGAASGIGLATARLLAEGGFRIVAIDLCDASPAYDAQWRALRVDVASAGAGEQIVDAALGAYGRLDVLVACAGVYETTPLDELSAETFDRVQEVNVRGTFVCARAALGAMRTRGWGRIVLLSSIAAHNGGLSAGPAYVASKAAVMGLTRSLAHAAGPHGVTVNCVNPGVIETPMTEAMNGDAKRESAARAPLRRNGAPEEVAAVIAMLCSDGAAFVTGAHLDVNGGLAMT